MGRNLEIDVDRVDCIIDFETLDTAPSTVVLSIGACLFKPYRSEIVNEFYYVLTIQDQIDAGRTISESTMMWWMQQGEEARKALFDPKIKRCSLDKALFLFASWLPEYTCVWGNGASFDISILDNLYGYKKMPYKHWNVRDIRTVVDMASPIMQKSDFPFKGVKHHALDDAKHEAEYVSAMWRLLMSGLGDF